MPPPITSPPACFICGGDDHRPLFVKNGRQFWKCRGCGLQRQHPLPTSQELTDYYESAYQSGMYEEFARARELKDLTARQRLRELRRDVPLAGRWLDVGASTGNFAYEAAQLGIDCEGVELSGTSAAQGREHGVTMHVGALDSLPNEPAYDCITAFDVIEHVLDPPQLVDDAVARLKPGGHLVLSLPDLGTWVRRLMGARWYFYIPEEHLHYFTRATIRRLLEGHGLRVKRVRGTSKPMTFDYAQTQFAEYNPLIHRVLRVCGEVLPKSLRQWPAPLPIGEMCAVAEKAAED